MKKLLLSALMLSAGVASAQWTEQATGFNAASRGINEIRIVNANVVWCVAYDGVDTANNIQEFTKTTDGGENWTAGFVDLGGDPDLAINNLQAIDENTAWVSSINGDVGGGSMFKTSDGGSVWDFVDPTPTGQSTPAFGYAASFQNVVHFFDANNGLVQGDPTNTGPIYDYEIYTTTDGGTTWTRVPAANLPNAANASEYGYNGGNRGDSELFWFVTNTGKLYRTTKNTMNSPTGWERLNTPISDFGAAATNGRVYFTNLNGTLAGATGVLIATTNSGTSYSRYTTTDGGATWSAATAYTVAYQNMEFIPGTTVLVATGNNGAAYTTAYSTDLGATWIEIEADDLQKSAIAFLDGSTGWAGGFNEDATTGGIYKYTGAALGIPTVANRPQFTATPNPTNGILNVANENANITDVVVFDLLGKQVYNGKFSALNEVNLDLTSLNAGAYILTATADNGAKQTIKIMKN